jgi:hypothetical protein
LVTLQIFDISRRNILLRLDFKESQMDKSNPDRIRLLDDLLQIMITHWGVALIRRRLEQIEGERSQKKRRIGARASSRGALAYVGGMALEPDKKNLMHELASRFESKTFLPTIGDVRNFFELQHLPIANFKGRSAAAPRIMDALAGLPHRASLPASVLNFAILPI